MFLPTQTKIKIKFPELNKPIIEETACSVKLVIYLNVELRSYCIFCRYLIRKVVLVLLIKLLILLFYKYYLFYTRLLAVLNYTSSNTGIRNTNK